MLVRWDTGPPQEARFFPPLLGKQLRRKEMTSLEFMLGHPHYASQEALSSR